MSVPVLTIRGATKAFGGAVALRGVDLTVGTGEIHALLGENGAGKSTLIKLLAAVHSADGGAFEIEGKPLSEGFGPREIAEAGIRFVHQDFGLIDTMSVMENMALVGGFVRRRGFIDHPASSTRAARQLERLGLVVDPAMLVGDLSVAEKAIVALARAMEGEAKLIVLDEVTAALPSPDVARVHAAIRAARERGISFVYVSHRLEEVFQLCDKLTVLRDGGNVATAEVGAVNLEQVVAWIAGRSVHLERTRSSSRAGSRRLAVSMLVGNETEGPTTLVVAAGEILGVTGIIGSGYDSICEMIAGIRPARSGRVEIDGVALRPGSTAASRAAGLEIVLGDRTRAAFAERSLRENLFADRLFRSGSWPSLGGEKRQAKELVAAFDVRPKHSVELAIQSLSGGNQQKVLFARALMADPKVLVLIDPTAGVDVGARAELHGLLRQAAGQGAAVLFASSDFEEIGVIADRVLIVRDSRIVAEVAGEEMTWDRLFMEAHRGSTTASAPGVSERRVS